MFNGSQKHEWAPAAGSRDFGHSASPPGCTPDPVCLPVRHEPHIGLARQATKALAERMGFSQIFAACVTTSVSELASNQVFHTPEGGTILLRILRTEHQVGIEVVAVDSGPGIADVTAAMRDGFSTDGGLGGGLPGVKRLMDEFSVESQVGSGTRVTAVKWQICR